MIFININLNSLTKLSNTKIIYKMSYLRKESSIYQDGIGLNKGVELIILIHSYKRLLNLIILT